MLCMYGTAIFYFKTCLASKNTVNFCPQLLKTFTLIIYEFVHYYLHSNLSNIINAFIASRADVPLACHTIL